MEIQETESRELDGWDIEVNLREAESYLNGLIEDINNGAEEDDVFPNAWDEGTLNTLHAIAARIERVISLAEVSVS